MTTSTANTANTANIREYAEMDAILRDLQLHMVCGERRAFEEALLNAERYMAELIAENLTLKERVWDLIRENQDLMYETYSIPE